MKNRHSPIEQHTTYIRATCVVRGRADNPSPNTVWLLNDGNGTVVYCEHNESPAPYNILTQQRLFVTAMFDGEPDSAIDMATSSHAEAVRSFLSRHWQGHGPLHVETAFNV